jgi:hypothetical protein
LATAALLFIESKGIIHLYLHRLACLAIIVWIQTGRRTFQSGRGEEEMTENLRGELVPVKNQKGGDLGAAGGVLIRGIMLFRYGPLRGGNVHRLRLAECGE